MPRARSPAASKTDCAPTGRATLRPTNQARRQVGIALMDREYQAPIPSPGPSRFGQASIDRHVLFGHSSLTVPTLQSPLSARRRTTARDPGRRQRLLEVARRHFTERGFVGTRLEAVAADAGCAKGTIYLEFADKSDLLREVLDQAFAGIMARFTRDVVRLDSPLDRLRETLRFAYRQHMAEPLFGRLLTDDPELRVLRSGREDEWHAAAVERAALIEGWVDEGIAIGEIRPDVDRAAVASVLGLLRFAPQHLALVAAASSLSGDRILDAVVDIFAAGLSARPDGRGASNAVRQARTADPVRDGTT
jgi:AcrR family transcriptional regulator